MPRKHFAPGYDTGHGIRLCTGAIAVKFSQANFLDGDSMKNLPPLETLLGAPLHRNPCSHKTKHDAHDEPQKKSPSCAIAPYSSSISACFVYDSTAANCAKWAKNAKSR